MIKEFDWLLDDDEMKQIGQAARDMYEYYMLPFDAKVGDDAYDDITKEIHTIIKVIDKGDALMGGYQIDSSWLDGYRYPWELTNPMRYDAYIPKNIVLGED